MVRVCLHSQSIFLFFFLLLSIIPFSMAFPVLGRESPGSVALRRVGANQKRLAEYGDFREHRMRAQAVPDPVAPIRKPVIRRGTGPKGRASAIIAMGSDSL